MEFVINPAPILIESSLNAGGSRRAQDPSFKLLNSFTIQSIVKKEQGSTSVFKGDFLPKNSGRLIRWRGGIDGHDRTMIMAHQSEMIVVLISPQMSDDRAAIGPRSRDDQTTIAR